MLIGVAWYILAIGNAASRLMDIGLIALFVFWIVAKGRPPQRKTPKDTRSER